ncbi:hypothetical protein VTH06DRAFT_7998 [Thermothelomyces fergusii]
MGRFGSLFKRSSEKEKPESNPYAQQSPATQSSAPPQYEPYAPYNAAQYNNNQSISLPPAGAPSNVPSSLRPGGPPPQYSPDPAQPSPSGSQRPPYGVGSPYSNASSPSMGTGFAKERYGAQDGVGQNRFEPATSPYAGSASPSLQNQGGYGNLGASSSGDLFATYNGSSKQSMSPAPGRNDASYNPAMEQSETREMTEEEKEEALVNSTKAEILNLMYQTNEAGMRVEAKAIEANERMRLMNEQLLRQSEMLNSAEKKTFKTRSEVEVSTVNLDDLDAANKPIFNLVANSKTKIQSRAQKKLEIQRQHEVLAERTMQEEHNLERKWRAEKQRLDANRPQELLGAKKKTDFSQFEFEDDDGEQREQNERFEQISGNILEQARILRENAQFQGFIINEQIKQLDRITENVQASEDKLGKNIIRINSTYK